jgi:hypothetical protein
VGQFKAVSGSGTNAGPFSIYLLGGEQLKLHLPVLLR